MNCHLSIRTKKTYYLYLILFLQIFIYQNVNAQKNTIKTEEINEKKIRALLKQHEINSDFRKLGGIFLNDKGVLFHQNSLANNKDSSRAILIHADIADQLLKAGKSEEAIQELLKILPQAKDFKKPDVYLGNLYNDLSKLLALSYMRLGEQANCIINHNEESCIFPLQGKGIYSITDPTRKAIKVYEELLERTPYDLESMWLLNIAYMTLGKYPDSVPQKYRIPVNRYDVPYPYGKFTDVAIQKGVETAGLSGSVILDDFDNDEDLDIFFVHLAFDAQCHYFENKGDGTFEDKTIQAGLSGEVSGRTCVQADYNNDGYLDIFIVRGAWEIQEDNFPPCSLLRNNGDGTFTDVTIQSGLLGFNPSYNATWLDYNNDGYTDLFISNETPDRNKPHAAQFFRNNGDGTFTDVAKELGIDPKGWTKGLSSFDYNNDGWSDLYICRADGPNFLYKNNGPDAQGKFSFTNVAKEAGVGGHYCAFYVLSLDFNNDGWIDLFTSRSSFEFEYLTNALINNYLGKDSKPDAHPKFYMNDGDGTFRDAGEEIKLDRVIYNMGLNTGDIDNDGYPDMYLGTGNLLLSSLIPNLMLRNNNGKFFEDVTTSSGTGNLQHGHGVAFGDIDNDGDQDIFQVMGGSYTGDVYQNVLYSNPGSANRWLKLRLEGVKTNRASLGVRLKVNVQNKEGERTIYTMVSSGGSFGASTLRREIGLGKAEKINYVEIFWPTSKQPQIIKNLGVNKMYHIKEGETTATEIPVKGMNKKQEKKGAHPHK